MGPSYGWTPAKRLLVLVVVLSVGGTACGHFLSTWTRMSIAQVPPQEANSTRLVPTKTPVFIIRTEADAKRLAAVHSTEAKEIMFTTFSFQHKGQEHPEMVEFAAHLWRSLKEIGRLENTALITHHLHTCQVVMERGIPCFLDRWSLQPAQLPGQYKEEVPHYYLKFSWALHFVKWGYTTLFIEMDQVFFQDPFPHFNRRQYDLEDLSDWRKAEIPGPKTRFLETCPHYYMKKLVQEKGGQVSITSQKSVDNTGQRLQWGRSNAADPSTTKHVNPCASTGFWVVQPVPSVIRWLTDFIDVALYKQNEQIEQQVWNEMIGAYLYGTSEFPPLRLGLLNDAKFLNIEVYEWRKERNLTVDPVMLHAANIQGLDKMMKLKELQVWRADAWVPTVASSHVEWLSRQFVKDLPLIN